MIQIDDKSKCCGCSACYQICPSKCIAMEQDKEGFLYPVVNEVQCKQCGLCEKICPVQNVKEVKCDTLKSYVAYIKDETVRLKSSSGGMFTLFAEEILNRQGVVFGAAFDDAFLVQHIAIQTKADLAWLQGSKYLQSRIEETYKEAKKFLEAGRFVLYTGTACQIAGLKAYLHKDYEKLYTIDVLCHGVPTPKLWQHYIKCQEKQYKASVSSVFFRNKSSGWKNYSVQLVFKNAMAHMNKFANDEYMRLFLSDICLRPSCHDCKFKALNRSSDLTLGDCWGIENYMPHMDDDKGTSVVLVHSTKGQKMFEDLKEQMRYCEAEVDKALPPTADSRKSVNMHPKRDKLFAQLEKGKDVSDLVKLVEPSLFSKVKRRIKKMIHL